MKNKLYKFENVLENVDFYILAKSEKDAMTNFYEGKIDYKTRLVETK